MTGPLRRVGILGGAFNPPHQGHLRLAELGLEHLGLEEVRFIPTARSPHKPTEGPGGAVRLDLLRAALEESFKPFRVESLEVDRGGTSYTVDTLEVLHQREPDVVWVLLLGSDQLPGLATWKRLDRILELATLAVAERPGHPIVLPPVLADRWQPQWQGQSGALVPLPGTDLDIASSRLRDQLEGGLEPEGLATQVRQSIQRHNLYRTSV